MNLIWKSEYFYIPSGNVDYDSILTNTDLDQFCQELSEKFEDLKKLILKETSFLKIHQWTFKLKKNEIFEEDFSLLANKIKKACGKALVMVEVSPPSLENAQEDAIISESIPCLSLRFFKNTHYKSSSEIGFNKELDISGRVWLGDVDLSMQVRSDREELD